MRKGVKDSSWDKKVRGNIPEEVLARLTGEDEEQFRERQINKIKDRMIARYNSKRPKESLVFAIAQAQRTRENVFYSRWDRLANVLATNASKPEIMEFVFRLIEECSGHHRDWIAQSSHRQLNQVIIERGWNNAK